MKNATQYVIKFVPPYGGETLYIEPAQTGCINWTADLAEARTWTSEKRATNFAERWIISTSGWNAQTDTQGPRSKRIGITVVAK